MIINYLTNIIYYKLIKVIIDILDLVEVIMDILIHYPCISKSIYINQDSLFSSKFWSLFYYFFGMKKYYL